jgi:hypothetical protein
MPPTIDDRWEQLVQAVADIFEQNGRYLDTMMAPHDRPALTLRVQMSNGATYHSTKLTEPQLLNEDLVVFASRFYEDCLDCEKEESV